MPLTPADVDYVAFTESAIGAPGVDADEVDDFLDGVARELAHLIEENHELRTRLEPADGPQLAAELIDLRGQLDWVERDKAAAEEAVRAVRAELEQARLHRGPAVAGDGEQRALQVVMAAQRIADDHVADALREAEKLLSDAGATAQQVTEQARTAADTVERDARRRHQEAVGALDAKRTAAQKAVEELRQLARDYRARLTAQLERQLGDLGDVDTRRKELQAPDDPAA